MFQEPCERDGRAGEAAAFGDGVEFGNDRRGPINFLPGKQAARAAAELAAGERTPGQRSDFVQEAMVESAVLEADQIGEADFNLINDEWAWTTALQSVELRGTKVADAKFADFPLLAKLDEGFADFVGVHQVIGAMEL